MTATIFQNAFSRTKKADADQIELFQICARGCRWLPHGTVGATPLLRCCACIHSDCCRGGRRNWLYYQRTRRSYQCGSNGRAGFASVQQKTQTKPISFGLYCCDRQYYYVGFAVGSGLGHRPLIRRRRCSVRSGGGFIHKSRHNRNG